MIFGKAKRGEWNGSRFYLSTVPWGPIRRYKARHCQPSFFSTGAEFIPKREIAIWAAWPPIVLEEYPEGVLYFRDKELAVDMFWRLYSVFSQGGLDCEEALDLLKYAEPAQQHGWFLRSSWQQLSN
jgi:hypothetical protein